MTIQRISFVWNADFSLASGIRALKEAADGHHSCSLCEIAYHRVRQTGDWKAYKDDLRQRTGADIREPCRNQLKADERLTAAGDFPAVLARLDNGQLIKLLGGDTIEACNGEFAPFRDKLDHALDGLLKTT